MSHAEGVSRKISASILFLLNLFEYLCIFSFVLSGSTPSAVDAQQEAILKQKQQEAELAEKTKQMFHNVSDYMRSEMQGIVSYNSYIYFIFILYIYIIFIPIYILIKLKCIFTFQFYQQYL